MTRPGPRLAAAAGWLALVVVLLIPGGAFAGTASRGPATTLATAEQSDADVLLDRLDPATPAPGGDLTVSGRVVNRTDAALTDVTVRLRVDRTRLNSRSEIALQSSPDTALREGVPVPDSEKPVDTVIPPGGESEFTITYPLDDLGLPATFGVYALSVDVRTEGRTAGTTRTFLPWSPSPEPVQPTRLAWLWPLASTPSRDAQEVFADDSLADEVAEGGRLRGLVEAAEGHDVTWTVDPELLESLTDMSNGYKVRSGDGTRAGKGARDAAALLERLRAVTADSSTDVMALPYADPDVAALGRGGLAGDIALATKKGKQVTTSVLDREVTSDIAWPDEGFLDQATLENLRRTGSTSVVLSDQAAPVTEPLVYTPTGRADLPTGSGQKMTGLLADATLSSLVAADTSEPGSEVLTRQRFLAETAMISAERPNDPRTVLVAPPHRWAPDPSFVGGLLDATTEAPWVEPISLDEMRDEPAPDVERDKLHYPKEVRQRELSRPYIDTVASGRSSVAGLEEILVHPERIVPRFDAALLRTESSAWRTSRRRGEEFLDTVIERLDRDVGAVRIVSGDLVTLSSTSGTIPVTIENSLSQPVRVSLRMTPRNRSRLSVEVPPPQTIQAYRKATIEVPAEAAANGMVVVDTVLTTPKNNVYGESMAIRVRATNYGTLGTVVMVTAAALLFIRAGVRVARRIRTGRGGPDEPVTQREKVGT